MSNLAKRFIGYWVPDPSFSKFVLLVLLAEALMRSKIEFETQLLFICASFGRSVLMALITRVTIGISKAKTVVETVMKRREGTIDDANRGYERSP